MLDPEHIAELQQSMAQTGQWDAVLVRPWEDAYQIVAGHCRVEAARNLDWHEILAEVRDMTDEEADFLLLDTNFKRRNFSEMQEAEGIRHMMQAHGWTQERVAKMFGKTKMWVSYRLSLLGLHPEVKDKVNARLLTPTHAREIAQAPPEVQPAIAAKVQQADLSTRQTEQLVKVVTAKDVPEDVKQAVLERPALRIEQAEVIAKMPDPKRRENMLFCAERELMSTHELQQEVERAQRPPEPPEPVDLELEREERQIQREIADIAFLSLCENVVRMTEELDCDSFHEQLIERDLEPALVEVTVQRAINALQQVLAWTRRPRANSAKTGTGNVVVPFPGVRRH